MTQSATALKTETQLRNREILACEHGIKGKCYWCDFNPNQSAEKRLDDIEEKFCALVNLIKRILAFTLQAPSKTSLTATTNNITQTTTTGDTLISSGLDTAKPSGGGGLAFFFATDTDIIYQRRDNSWIDISYSRTNASGEK